VTETGPELPTPDLDQKWINIASALTTELAKVVGVHTDAAWWIDNKEAVSIHVTHPAAKASGTNEGAIVNKILDHKRTLR
jgi:hypothetical protein